MATEKTDDVKPTGLALLREPFPPNQISKLPKPYKKDSPKGTCKECGGYHGLPAAHLDYVGHAALTDRLLDCDPQWSWEPVAYRDGLPAFDESGGLWIRLTVCGVSRLGYGHADAKPYMDKGAREKEVIGDALRNAAMRFGAALDLWHKGDLHADDDEPQKNGETVVRDMTSTKVTPNADAEKNVTTEEQERVRKVADEIIDAFKLYQPEAALTVYEEANLSNEEKLFLWTLLDSTQRNSLKRLGKEKREKQPKAA